MNKFIGRKNELEVIGHLYENEPIDKKVYDARLERNGLISGTNTVVRICCFQIGFSAKIYIEEPWDGRKTFWINLWDNCAEECICGQNIYKEKNTVTYRYVYTVPEGQAYTGTECFSVRGVCMQWYVCGCQLLCSPYISDWSSFKRERK